MRGASIKLVLFWCAVLLLVIATPLLFRVVVTQAGNFPEAATIGKGARDFQELSDRFKALADSKGAVYAFQVLGRADLPPNTDLHLLGHAVGDELYEQEGVEGIKECTQDFRNACSHSIVIGTLNEYGAGETAVQKIHDSCKLAPGGSGAYTMCYHGLGHGVFAYYGYDLAKTVAFCKKTGTPEYHDQEYSQCVGGSIMELVGGGGHDHDLWVVSHEKYYRENDSLAPCSSSVIPRDAKAFCYLYITPHLFEVAGDLGSPQPRQFSAAFADCDRISKDSPDLRGACFGGIGKEFPVLAMLRDIRNVADASDAQLRQMREWCQLAPHQEAYDACAGSVIASLFWGGENDPKAAVRFCALAEGDERAACFDTLFGEAAQYVQQGSPEGKALCSKVPEGFAQACTSALSS